jgi:hypothetical protein
LKVGPPLVLLPPSSDAAPLLLLAACTRDVDGACADAAAALVRCRSPAAAQRVSGSAVGPVSGDLKAGPPAGAAAALVRRHAAVAARCVHEGCRWCLCRCRRRPRPMSLLCYCSTRERLALVARACRRRAGGHEPEDGAAADIAAALARRHAASLLLACARDVDVLALAAVGPASMDLWLLVRRHTAAAVCRCSPRAPGTSMCSCSPPIDRRAGLGDVAAADALATFV